MDDIDRANDLTQNGTDKIIGAIRAQATLPPGKPGECDLCGEHSMRLVEGACSPCRDKWKLP